MTRELQPSTDSRDEICEDSVYRYLLYSGLEGEGLDTIYNEIFSRAEREHTLENPKLPFRFRCLQLAVQKVDWINLHPHLIPKQVSEIEEGPEVDRRLRLSLLSLSLPQRNIAILTIDDDISAPDVSQILGMDTDLVLHTRLEALKSLRDLGV